MENTKDPQKPKASPSPSVYGDEISTYIEECRQYAARTHASTHRALGQNSLPKEKVDLAVDSHQSESVVANSALVQKEADLRKLEADLARRESELILREIKLYGLQKELDNLRPLAGLFRVVKAMATERKLKALLETIARETQDMLQCDRCSVFVLDHKRIELWTQVAQGLGNDEVLRIPLTGNSIVGITARSGQTLNVPDAYKDPRFNPQIDAVTGYHTKNILCVPLHNHDGEIIGVFEVLNKVNGSFTDKDQEWLVGLAAVASGLIEQAQTNAEIETFVEKTLETLAQTIDKRDPLTAGHSIRVTRYSVLIGQAMSVPLRDLDVLRYAAMMHDFGKIGVPEAILWKNGRLTPEEYAIVQTHARTTYELLSNIPFTHRLQAVPFVASCHHEKLDGSGYYRGLSGPEIPFLTRIITVADVFDALTSVRHYRNRMSITRVNEIMEAGRDNHFDSSVIDTFLTLPCDQVLQVMESERDQRFPMDLNLFKDLSWRRLVELLSGAKANDQEAHLTELFNHAYNDGLPVDYRALD